MISIIIVHYSFLCLEDCRLKAYIIRFFNVLADNWLSLSINQIAVKLDLRRHWLWQFCTSLEVPGQSLRSEHSGLQNLSRCCWQFKSQRDHLDQGSQPLLWHECVWMLVITSSGFDWYWPGVGGTAVCPGKMSPVDSNVGKIQLILYLKAEIISRGFRFKSYHIYTVCWLCWCLNDWIRASDRFLPRCPGLVE